MHRSSLQPPVPTAFRRCTTTTCSLLPQSFVLLLTTFYNIIHTERADPHQVCFSLDTRGPSLSNFPRPPLVCRRTATRSHATLQEVSRLSQPLQHRRTAPHTLARVLGLKCTPHWARARAQVHARARRCHASKRACQRFPAHASKTAQASASQRMPAGSTVHASTT